MDYNHTHLERLKLAADVILSEADSPAVTDALEAELTIFKHHIEHTLLAAGEGDSAGVQQRD